MSQKAIDILIELLRVFIYSPHRTKADATILEAKLSELKEELKSNLEV